MRGIPMMSQAREHSRPSGADYDAKLRLIQGSYPHRSCPAFSHLAQAKVKAIIKLQQS